MVALVGTLLLLGTAAAVEHPGVVRRDSDCTSCHEAKLKGRSVHSAMAGSCDMCHIVTTQGDMTSVSLSMPKTKICSACHDAPSALRQHVPEVKGSCVDCHDAHSSARKMLLLDAVLVKK